MLVKFELLIVYNVNTLNFYLVNKKDSFTPLLLSWSTLHIDI